MKRSVILLCGLLMAGSAMADQVRVITGDLILSKDDGSQTTLVDSNDIREATMSPDGNWIAYVRAPGAGREEIWLMDSRSKVSRKLLSSKPHQDPKKNLTDFNTLAFSASSRQLFFLSSAWGDSDALHRMSLTSSRALFITDANDLRVITRGPKAGSLLVQQTHSYYDGAKRNRWSLVTSGGREVRELGDDLEEVLATLN